MFLLLKRKKGLMGMVLIEVRSLDGKLIGRCDARCYEAQHPRCLCICGGKNHGGGVSRAVGNVRKEVFCEHVKQRWEGCSIVFGDPTEEEIVQEQKRCGRAQASGPKPLRGQQYMVSLFAEKGDDYGEFSNYWQLGEGQERVAASV